jgi:hypothetical protein
MNQFEKLIEMNRRYLKPHLNFLCKYGYLENLGHKKGYVLGHKIYRPLKEYDKSKNESKGKHLSKVGSEGGPYFPRDHEMLKYTIFVLDYLSKYKSEHMRWYHSGQVGIIGDFADKKLVDKLDQLRKEYNISLIAFQTNNKE